jgi:zinc transporter ZupT
MMMNTTLQLFFALSISLTILMAGWYPFKKRLRDGEHVDFPLGETLATGVFLGAALLHMLPEANRLFQNQNIQYPLAYLITGIVFLLFLWFEHLGKELYHHQESTHPAFAILAWMMLSVHSLVVGTALGISHDYPIMIMLFLAIITHKWAESFAIAIQLNKSSLKPRNSFLLFLFFMLMTPLGIYLGWYFGQGEEAQSIFVPILIASSAGTFLYLGTLHGLERCVMVERCCNLRDFSFVIIGFFLMAAVAAWA